MTTATKRSRIPLCKPVLGDEELCAIQRPLLSGWVTQGPEVEAFEEEFAAFVGAEHACAVSSCTAALHLALLATGVEPGDEVITVSHTYIATTNAIRYCGATPVFIDIDPETYNMDPVGLERAMTPRTTAILCVHQMGMPCDMQSILAIARQHGVPVIEDAACAIGSGIEIDSVWQPVGQPHGDICCFSFHPRKVITTGDGGMLTTRRADWDERFRRLRQHAMSVPDTVRHQAGAVIFEDYPEMGFNYRMTDMQAAVGRVQLERLCDIVDRRRALAERYSAALGHIVGLKVPVEPAGVQTNWQSYCVELPPWCDRRAVMQMMLADGVATRRSIMCAHLERACAGIPTPWPLDHSERASARGVVIPLFTQMTDEEQAAVCVSLEQACCAQAIN